MSEMVERVARAMCWKQHEDNEVAERAWVSCREEYIADSRAAIEEMRTPDEAMEAAGYVVTVDDAVEIWQTMIDAALATP